MDFNLIAQFSLFDPASLWAMFQMIVGLGFVIFVHELGHFAVAKACGVKCEKFYVGFDAFDIKIGDRVIVPRKLVHWKWGETEYGVGILPLGGYVKMLGQDDNPSQINEERKRSLQDAESSQTDTNLPTQRPRLDPRSYQAKSVPQRMAIISAGVIMNLIFAVIFAAIAFGIGVNYEPPQIGFTTPGSPAWQHNLDGATVLAIGEQSTQGKYFTFGHLREAIVFDGGDQPIELLIMPAPELSALSSSPIDETSLKPVKLSIQPARNLFRIKGAEGLPAIGISPSASAVLGSNAIAEGHSAALADPPFMAGDKIVSVDGKSIVRHLTDENGRPYKQHNVFLLRMLLAQNTDEPVDITVERTDTKTKQVTRVTSIVPPNPLRTLGLEMEIGKIAAIQRNSPAFFAGMQIGDLIIAIDGAPVGDPFTLHSRMTKMARAEESVEFTVERQPEGSSEFETIQLSVRPRLPRAPSLPDEDHPYAIDTLGIAFHVKNIVAGVGDFADGTVADLEPGTRILRIHFKLTPEQASRVAPIARNPIDLSNNRIAWPIIDALMQQMEPGTRVELVCEHENKKQIIDTTIMNYPGFFSVGRGMRIGTEQMSYRAKSIWESMQLGLNQTWLDATKVLRFLGKLIRGEISLTSLGGPGTIVMAATSEASQGTSRLLLFLTLLSANLAVINFLPIPVLDGGHMMFLAYEGIFRRPVSERLQIILSFAGLIFIVGLMLLVISLDVWRWSGLF